MPTVHELDPAQRKGIRDGRARPVLTDYQGDVAIARPVGYTRRTREVANSFTIHERRRQAYQLATARFSPMKIGLHLHADPSVCTNKARPDPTKGTPGGYGWRNYVAGKEPLLGPGLVKAVSKDLARGLELAAKYEARSREEYLQMELDGLAEAQAAIWAKVLAGNINAVEQFVAISARRCKILGLDDNTLTVNSNMTIEAVTGALPTVNAEYEAKFMAALEQVGAIKAAPVDTDIVDAEIVDTTSP